MGTKLRAQAKQQYFDGSGNPAAGFKVYTYEPGTSTNKVTYVDSAQTGTNTNPIVLDQRGEADVWWNGLYKIKFTDASDVEIWTVDNYGAGEDDAIPSATSIIANNSFEVDAESDNLPDSWDNVDYAGSTNLVVTTDQDHGLKSMKFTSVGSGGGFITTSAFMEASPAVPFNFGFSIMSSVVDVRNVVQVLWFTEAKVAASVTSTDVYDDSTTNPTAWTTYRYQVTPPADAYYCKVRLYGCHSSDSTPGSTWYDNIVLNPLESEVIKGSDVASANDLPVDYATYYDVTGAVDTNGMTSRPLGTIITLQYDSALTIKHNTAASAGFDSYSLPDSTDITTSAGDIARYISEGPGNNWRMLTYRSYSTTPVGVLGGHLFGLKLSNNVTDATNDLDIAVGEATDSTSAYMMKLTSAFTKQLDATWAVGTNAGGLFSGTEAVSTWYHVFVIRKDSDSSVDVGFDTSVIAANIPAGYTAYRRIGSIYNNNASIIEPFLQEGDLFTWKTNQSNIVDVISIPTSRTALTISAPPGVRCLAHLGSYARATSTSTTAYAIVAGDNVETAFSLSTNNTLSYTDTGSGHTRYETNGLVLLTDTSAQIFYMASVVSASHYLTIFTRAYGDDRGRT